MLKMTDEQLITSLKSGMLDLPGAAWIELFVLGGMLELDLQTGKASFWPGREMDVHPHPKIVLGGIGKQRVAERLQLWVPPIFPEGCNLAYEEVLKHVYRLFDDLVEEIRAKECVLPTMIQIAHMPTGYLFSMPLAAYNEYLSLGGSPGSARPLVLDLGTGEH